MTGIWRCTHGNMNWGKEAVDCSTFFFSSSFFIFLRTLFFIIIMQCGVGNSHNFESNTPWWLTCSTFSSTHFFLDSFYITSAGAIPTNIVVSSCWVISFELFFLFFSFERMCKYPLTPAVTFQTFRFYGQVSCLCVQYSELEFMPNTKAYIQQWNGTLKSSFTGFSLMTSVQTMWTWEMDVLNQFLKYINIYHIG